MTSEATDSLTTTVLPLTDLHRVDTEFLSDFVRRLQATDSLQGDLGLQLR